MPSTVSISKTKAKVNRHRPAHHMVNSGSVAVGDGERGFLFNHAVSDVREGSNAIGSELERSSDKGVSDGASVGCEACGKIDGNPSEQNLGMGLPNGTKNLGNLLRSTSGDGGTDDAMGVAGGAEKAGAAKGGKTSGRMTHDFGPPQMCIYIPKGKVQRGRFITIDQADASLVGRFRWFIVTWKGTDSYYATGYPKDRSWQDGRRISMHRLVTDAPKGTLVDHRNGNGLNNRKSNLRVCGHAQNTQNRRRYKSGFKGVIKEPDCRKFRAYIGVNKGSVPVGWFDTAEDAARAYDRAARARHGEFACLNFPNPGERSALTGEIVPLNESAA